MRTGSAQQEIFPQRHVEDEPVKVAILRYDSHRRTVTARDSKRSGSRPARARKDFDQLGLPVTIDTRDAHDLAGAQTQRDSIQDRHTMLAISKILDFEQSGGIC